MSTRARRSFTDAFKADAVKLVRSGNKTIEQVAKQLNVLPSSLREWVTRATAATSESVAVAEPRPEELNKPEREELLELRKRVKRLEMERDILKKATAFFAKENA
jgi:transposase-like protein